MTFPLIFPFTFESDRGSGLPITGWWPDINVDFALSVPPQLELAGKVAPHLGLSVPPTLAFAATPQVQGAFNLSVPPSLSGVGLPVEVGAFGLSVPPTLGFSAAANVPAAFALSVPPSLAAAAAMTQPGAFGLSLPPTLAFTGAPIPTYDNSAKSAHQPSLASGSPFTFNVTAAAGDYAAVVIWGSAATIGPAAGIAAVTINGQTMTALGYVYANNNTAGQYAWVFAYNDASANALNNGSNTVSVTPTQSGGVTFGGYGTAHTFKNVTGLGSLQTAHGSSASPSVAVTAAASTDVVFGGIIAGAAVSAFSLTNRQSSTSSPAFVTGDATGSTSQTVSGTITSNVWAAFGIDFQ